VNGSRIFKLCGICLRTYHNCAVRQCPHPKANGRNICRYCCQRCKYNTYVGTMQGCSYAEQEAARAGFEDEKVKLPNQKEKRL
jgi:hypothetical protein